MDLLQQGYRPEIIILDMNMPGWGGARTLPRLRAALPEVPILLSTGRADQRALDLAHAFPGVTILAKPFSFRELQATFAAVLQQD
jgi:DNA-binding response OmpR family regulator